MEFLSSINESDAQKKAQMNQFFGEHEEFPTLMDTVKTLKLAEAAAWEYRGDDDEGRNISSRFDGTGEETGVHRRIYSTPPTLSIDDPVEEENSSGMWYAGSRRSPSPPAAPGESGLSSPIMSSPILDARQSLNSNFVNRVRQRSPSPPPVNGIDELLLTTRFPSPPPPTGNNSSPLHRKVLSTGYVEIPRLPLPTSQTKHSRSDRFNPSRSAKDSSLFRLIVTLQLCLVRIEEANSVLCDGQARAADRVADVGRSRSDSFVTKPSMSDLRFSRSSSSEFDTQFQSALVSRSNQTNGTSWKTHHLVAITIGVGGVALLSRRSNDREGQIQVLKTTGKVAAAMTTASFIRKRWRILCMNARVANSAEALEDWIFHWICLVNNKKGPADGAGTKLLTHRKMNSFWYSNGSIRIQLIKRGMDLLYASIGKAIEITRGKESNETAAVELKSSGLWTYVVASVAASYYNVIGPAAKSAQVISSSSTSIIQGAWGMVSLGAVKTASLEATRILKGAAIAGRIEICGVSCFVLSREPFPALASALRRFHRKQEREDARLGTIHEKLSSNPSSANVRGFQSRNVIFHICGGGFFTHTIACDLPYLLDWSAATNAVVIIPEYALLPHHKFPDAIEEVERIYRSLRFGHAVSLLGFRPDKIIVTGESVGGNLACALCVSLIMSYEVDQCAELTHLASMELVSDREGETDEEGESLAFLAGDTASQCRHVGIGLPDALMLCCPALNLSSEDTNSQSRIDGAHDPVLPSGLLAVISSSYVPNECDGNSPLASPYFATDVTLRQFPSTLIFTGSEDPLLDDSVTFNARLRGLGVKSYLRAVHDMPHAFWALSTVGIGLEVQSECQEWLRKAFCVR
jgi:acetyl esterase/lipase